MKRMVFKKNNPFFLAASCFAAYCVLRLFNLAGFLNVLSVLAYVFLAVMLFMNRRDFLLVIASAAPAAVSLLSILFGGGTNFLGFLGFVADLLIPAFVASFLLPQAEPYVGKYKNYLEKYWYVPAAAGAALWVFSMVSLFARTLSWGSVDIFFSIFNLGHLLQTALIIGGELMLCCSMVFPDGIPEAWFSSEAPKAEPVYNAATGTYEKPIPSASELELNLVMHILLLVFAGWIWLYIWIYRTTKALNNIPGEPYRNPVTKLLLCMFVPFYFIYWTYKSAQRIDKLAALNGIPSDIGTLCLILSIFVGIVPPIIMQEKMNTIASACPSCFVPTASYDSDPDYDYDSEYGTASDSEYAADSGNGYGKTAEPIPLEAPAEAPQLAAPTESTDLPAPQPSAEESKYLDDSKSMKKYI